MFRTVPVSIISSFALYTQQWYMSYSLRAGSGRNVIGSFFTVHTAMVYVIQLASRIRTELQFRPDPAHKLPANLYVLLCVQ